MVIDANMYWLPESLFEQEEFLQAFITRMNQLPDTCGYVKEEDGCKQIVVEKPTGFQSLNYGAGEYALSTQLQDLQRAHVDKAVLKLPGCAEWMDLSLCKQFNDLMAAHANASNGKLIPLAVVPPYDTKENLQELRRCIEELHMHGVQLSTHYGDRYLDDEQFQAFFALCNEYHMTVYVHHSPIPVEYHSIYEFNNLRRSYGRCVDQTTAIGRELFSGFFDHYPNIRMVHSMLGGGFFGIMNMLLPHASKQTDTIQRFDANERIREQLKTNIYFECSHAQPWGEAALKCAVDVLGADHILFGTSYPVRKEWLLQGSEFIQSLQISEEEKAMILYKNAKTLYHIEE